MSRKVFMKTYFMSLVSGLLFSVYSFADDAGSGSLPPPRQEPLFKQQSQMTPEQFERAMKALQKQAKEMDDAIPRNGCVQGYKAQRNRNDDWVETLDKNKNPIPCEKDVVAQAQLGYDYQRGTGLVNQDYARSKFWYEQASTQGNAFSKESLGNIYRDGLGVEKDYAKAFGFYKEAAEAGRTISQLNLANLYFNGQGTEKNYEQAKVWYEKAASATPENQTQDVTLESIYKNNSSWYETADSVLESKYQLAVIYENGFGVEKNMNEAVKWYKESAKDVNSLGDGYPPAQYRVAQLYEEGILHNRQVGDSFADGAEEWYENAANQNYPKAQIALADYYFNKQDTFHYEDAEKLYEKAFDNGESSAANKLGKLYEDGIFGGRSENNHDYIFLTKARDWYKKGIEKGNEESAANLKSIETAYADQLQYDYAVKVKKNNTSNADLENTKSSLLKLGKDLKSIFK